MFIRDEFSMTEKIYGEGRSHITDVGETFLVDIEQGEEGYLKRKLGNYYNEPTYSDMNNSRVEVSENVITADGVRRKLITINGVFPGPTLEVMEGAEIEVTVTNLMFHQSITMHWHGFHMHETPWMDGVATITQCPISPGSSFVYRFKASPSGTLWYHAHLGGLRADGAFGLFVVHKNEPPIMHYPLIVQHWAHMPYDDFMITNPYKKKLYGDIAGDGSNQYHHYVEKGIHTKWRAKDGVPLTSMIHTADLINGRGQFEDINSPLPWFNVTDNEEYVGFYLMNPGVEYTYNVSIDHHKMEVIGLGIGDVDPISVDAIYLNPGERVHIKVQLQKHKIVFNGEEMERVPKNYWIRAKTLNDLGEVKGVLHYPGADGKPETSPLSCTDQRPCTYYNCPYDDMIQPHVDCIGSYTFNGGEDAKNMHKLVQNVDMEVFVDFGFPIGASVNGYRFVNPKNHLYSSEAVIKGCDREECLDKPCYCTHFIDLPPNKTVQMVLSNIVDPNRLHGKHHTIHLHGHDFVILKTGYPDFNETTGLWTNLNSDIECPDEHICRKMRWTNSSDHLSLTPDNRPLSDTVLVPYGGYTVVRIFTGNPGYWLMHCHQMMHATEGMDVVVRVAPENAPKPPKNFPMNCGHFNFTHDEFVKYTRVGNQTKNSGVKTRILDHLLLIVLITLFI